MNDAVATILEIIVSIEAKVEANVSNEEYGKAIFATNFSEVKGPVKLLVKEKKSNITI